MVKVKKVGIVSKHTWFFSRNWWGKIILEKKYYGLKSFGVWGVGYNLKGEMVPIILWSVPRVMPIMVSNWFQLIRLWGR